MQIGVQSGYIFSDDNFEEGLRMIRDAGFDSVDFNIDEQLDVGKLVRTGENSFFSQDLDTIVAHYAPFKACADALGLRFGQMHAPFPVYVDGNDAANRALFDAFRKCMAVCAALDCPYLIVHPIAWNGTQEEERDKNIAFYSALIPTAKQYNVCICLENMFRGRNGHIEDAVCSDFREAAAYIDTLNDLAGEERFGFCYDVGHATLLGRNHRRCINQLGKRLKALHIHDNDGRNDLHMQPYAYSRGSMYVTDWDGFLDGLRDVGFDGVLSFETYHAVEYLPQALKSVMLSYIAGVGRYFQSVLTTA
jgi:sugar phosphate isomerase/epimerase